MVENDGNAPSPAHCKCAVLTYITNPPKTFNLSALLWNYRFKREFIPLEVVNGIRCKNRTYPRSFGDSVASLEHERIKLFSLLENGRLIKTRKKKQAKAANLSPA